MIPLRAWLALGAAVIAGLLAWAVVSSIYQRGKTDASAEIQQSNVKARGKADDAARKVENCIGSWDRDRGLCLRDDGAGR